MALIKYPECGRKVSDKAQVCIHCGFPIYEVKEQEVQSCFGMEDIKFSKRGKKHLENMWNIQGIALNRNIKV